LFCGENANPFTFPPLSPAEVIDANSHLYSVYELIVGRGSTSIAETLAGSGYAPEEITPVRFRLSFLSLLPAHHHFQQSLINFFTIPSFTSLRHVQGALAELRWTAYHRLYHPVPATLPVKPSEQDLQPYVAFTLCQVGIMWSRDVSRFPFCADRRLANVLHRLTLLVFLGTKGSACDDVRTTVGIEENYSKLLQTLQPIRDVHSVVDAFVTFVEISKRLGFALPQGRASL
jgi:hypothetical protein